MFVSWRDSDDFITERRIIVFIVYSGVDGFNCLFIGDDLQEGLLLHGLRNQLVLEGAIEAAGLKSGGYTVHATGLTSTLSFQLCNVNS